MKTIDGRRRGPHLLAALGLVLLTACGGGGGGTPQDGTPQPGQGGGTPQAPTLVAVGSSGRTTSLAWRPVAGATGYVIERRTAASVFAPVANLDAQADGFVDDGLEPNTAYTYRLAASGVEAPAAEQAATTSADLPITTTRPTTTGVASTAALDAAGGSLATADGRVRLSLAAGAFAGATEASLTPITNPLPDGRGDGVRVHLGALPAQAPTLTLAYAAAVDAEADGLGVAAQRADGSWLSLPVTAVDKAQRTLTVQLPAALVGDATAHSGARPLAARAVANVSIDIDVVTYLNFYLSPRESVVAAGGTQLLVPYAHTLVAVGSVCTRDELGTCLGLPVLDTREVPFENQKAGYARRWLVFADEGGTPALGTITPRATSGAVYHAPAQEPTPNPVIVTFESRHVASGNTLRLTASIRVREPVWTMTLHGLLEQSADIGFSFSAEAVWTREPGSADTYRANGTQSVQVINIVCTGSPSPASVALPPGALVIDRSVTPARYQLDVGSLWHTSISGTCPEGGYANVGMDVPGRLIVEGTLGGNGTTITGTTSQNHITWDWSLTNQL